jgi:hypothetical protein
MSLIESPDKINGNGHSRPQLSRRSLMRALPARLDTVDSCLADHRGCILDILLRVNALEAALGPIVERQQRIDRRALRFRRKLAVLTDYVETESKLD